MKAEYSVTLIRSYLGILAKRASRQVCCRPQQQPHTKFLLTLRSCLLCFLVASPLTAMAQGNLDSYWLQVHDKEPVNHRFLNATNLKLQATNVAAQTVALLAIQSHDDGGEMAPCLRANCTGALAARGRTLDPFEKHFESYGYGWGAAYRYGGLAGLDMGVAYLCHATGHHKLERWMPVLALAHAQASTGYALTGSSQGKNGW